ncbi:hypothetical protein [Caldimonas tepidiphila]|uniref:hypothetical protein n=1 Tax=Caldimonas tepidiphila TaxID=2315841 RepID=UPI000E5BC33D|nr:hypothetical protein [Caldimonas tepidiphila]
MQICEDLRQQRVEWTVERVAWGFLYALLGAIVLGLLGQGPLADARLQGPDGATLMEYKRFARKKSGERIKVTLPASKGSVRVMLDRGYLENVELKEVTPEPEKVIAQDDGTSFVFNTESARPVDAYFHFEPKSAGLLEGWVSVAEGPRQRFGQFVYP